MGKNLSILNYSKSVFLSCALIIALATLSGYSYYTLYSQITPSYIEEDGSISVCFTVKENCTQQIVNFIEGSEKTRAALYDLSEPGIIDALIQNDAQVLVYSGNYKHYGTPVKSKGLMHNKFFLIYNYSGTDNNFIITGSANPTKSDLYVNHNNVLFIKSKTIFKNYEEEFEEIFTQMENKRTKAQVVKLKSAVLRNYFCPEDSCEEKVLRELSKANSSIRFMVFSFTSDSIGKQLLSLSQQIEVSGLFDKGQVASNKEHSEYYRLKDSQANIAMKESPGKLHHKVFIIDEKTVITGSYNPTASGNERNDENILIIESHEIANIYMNEFQSLWVK